MKGFEEYCNEKKDEKSLVFDSITDVFHRNNQPKRDEWSRAKLTTLAKYKGKVVRMKTSSLVWQDNKRQILRAGTLGKVYDAQGLTIVLHKDNHELDIVGMTVSMLPLRGIPTSAWVGDIKLVDSKIEQDWLQQSRRKDYNQRSNSWESTNKEEFDKESPRYEEYHPKG